MNIRNIIFDLDGTLIDSSAGVVEAVNYALAQNGLPEEPPDRIVSYIGYPLERMFSDFTDFPYKKLHGEFQVKARESIIRSATALSGVDEVLARFHTTGFRMAVATTKIRRHVEGIIDKLGWRRYFATSVGADDVKKVKPSPDALHLVVKDLAADPAESIYIGDTENDVLAARAVPMLSVGVASPYGRTGELLLAGPDYFIEMIGDLPELITRLSNGARPE